MDPQLLNEFSVAEKMYWAAWREATKEEDEVCSLMGIFEVNIPPLYGEGHAQAFRRLQMEIMQRSHDHTIFAWNQPRTNGDMLATSPRDFSSHHTYRRMGLDIMHYKTSATLNQLITLKLDTAGFTVDSPLAEYIPLN